MAMSSCPTPEGVVQNDTVAVLCHIEFSRLYLDNTLSPSRDDSSDPPLRISWCACCTHLVLSSLESLDLSAIQYALSSCILPHWYQLEISVDIPLMISPSSLCCRLTIKLPMRLRTSFFRHTLKTERSAKKT